MSPKSLGWASMRLLWGRRYAWVLCLGCNTTMFVIVLSHQLLTVAPYICGSFGYICKGVACSEEGEGWIFGFLEVDIAFSTKLCSNQFEFCLIYLVDVGNHTIKVCRRVALTGQQVWAYFDLKGYFFHFLVEIDMKHLRWRDTLGFMKWCMYSWDNLDI